MPLAGAAPLAGLAGGVPGRLRRMIAVERGGQTGVEIAPRAFGSAGGA
jgi:hypothetical protein